MCGICGYAGSGAGRQSEEIIRRMRSTLTHRGPDDDGFYICDNAALGMRRLAIIDIAGGRQPMANEDASIQVVMNGEIYNYRELAGELAAKGHSIKTHSDTEVIPHLYEEYGDEFASKLNGMFGIALWDSAKNRLLVVRDRLGVKPVYYTHFGGRLYFGSELKSILAVPGFERRLDNAALDAYLTYSYIPAPLSIFESIKKLEPGEMLSYCNGSLAIKQWWNIPDEPPMNISEDEAAGMVRDLISDSVRMRLISDVPVGVFLSGGIDSTTAAAFAAKFSPNIKSFCIGFDEGSFDESGYARRAAAIIGTAHKEEILSMSSVPSLIPQIFSMLDEPMSDASLIPTWLLSRFTRGHVTVALSGDGADELFAGYPTYQAHKMFSLYNALPAMAKAAVKRSVALIPATDRYMTLGFKLKRFIASESRDVVERHFTWTGQFSPNDKTALLSPAFLTSLRDCGGVFDIPRKHIAGRSRQASDVEKAMRLDLIYYLGENLMTKVDRASMMHSLEVRTPFLDYRLVELAARLPLRMKLNGLKTKYILKKAVRSDTPDFVVKRRKKGFGVPLSAWIKKDLREDFRETLGPGRIAGDGVFSSKTVSGLLEDHLAGKIDNNRKLWNIYALNKWMDNWLKN
ncbi:MAG: asparagine synthase (glutamine-hydrolyzing) [bacterium]